MKGKFIRIFYTREAWLVLFIIGLTVELNTWIQENQLRFWVIIGVSIMLTFAGIYLRLRSREPF